MCVCVCVLFLEGGGATIVLIELYLSASTTSRRYYCCCSLRIDGFVERLRHSFEFIFLGERCRLFLLFFSVAYFCDN